MVSQWRSIFPLFKGHIIQTVMCLLRWVGTQAIEINLLINSGLVAGGWNRMKLCAHERETLRHLGTVMHCLMLIDTLCSYTHPKGLTHSCNSYSEIVWCKAVYKS